MASAGDPHRAPATNVRTSDGGKRDRTRLTQPNMIILGIETSCDETSAAIIEGSGDRVEIRSNIISSSLMMHAKTGGIIPENAAREQIKFILPVIQEALQKAFDTRGTRDTLDTLKRVDAIALTYGPGLIGSLLVGVETAKTISFVFNTPIVPINHMVGHIYANFISGNPKSQIRNPKLNPKPYTLTPDIKFPAIALVVSGGHTDLLLMKKHGDFQLLGGTRDDAAGEAFDKTARLLGFPYPGGPEIEKTAKNGDPKRFRFPRPLVGSGDFDFSFSGLKTAVLREVNSLRHPELVSGSMEIPDQVRNDKPLDAQTINDLSFATQEAIVDVLVKKTIKAVEKYDAKSILISGGVAANQSLRDQFKVQSSKFKVKFFAPAKNLCTDNAAMIACAAYFNNKSVSWKKVTANPELYF